MLHYPMHAFINLFINVLKAPDRQNMRSDLALLDVAAGYFGQMEFVTGSKLSFPFARDIASFARQTVDHIAARVSHPRTSSCARTVLALTLVKASSDRGI